MTLALSTRWLGPRPHTAERLLEVLRSLDVRACFLAPAAGAPPSDKLTEALRPAGAKVLGVAAADAGEGEPSGFAARGADARMRAFEGARSAARLGRAVGARDVVLRLGRFDLERAKERESELLAALRADGPSDQVREQAAGVASAIERRLEPALDLVCRMLFELCRAEPDVRFAIASPSVPFELPSPRALTLIFDEVRERNLGYWHDVGAAHRYAQLGCAPAHSWCGDFGPRTFGATLHDAAGADLGLPPGAGEIEFKSVREGLLSGVPCVVDVDARFPLDEVRLAVSYLRSVGFV